MNSELINMIYAIHIRSLNYLKIGITNNLQRRLCALRTGSPVELRVIGNWPGDPADEKMLHRGLSQWQVKGEWFQYSDEVRRIVEHCQSNQKTEFPKDLIHLLNKHSRKPQPKSPLTYFQLRQIRLGWEMTQSQFAAVLGVSARTYERWELPDKKVPDAAQAHIQTLAGLRKLFKAGTWTKAQQELWATAFPILQEEP